MLLADYAASLSVIDCFDVSRFSAYAGTELSAAVGDEVG